MFQVIYELRVDEDERTRFLDVWAQTTNAIHDTVPGALGSYCMASLDHPTYLKTVAKWSSITRWRDFIQSAKRGSMQSLHEIAECVHYEAYELLGDHTKSTE